MSRPLDHLDRLLLAADPDLAQRLAVPRDQALDEIRPPLRLVSRRRRETAEYELPDFDEAPRRS